MNSKHCKIKRIFTAILSLALCSGMLFGMTACKDDNNSSSSQPGSTPNGTVNGGTVVEKVYNHTIGKELFKNNDFETLNTKFYPYTHADWSYYPSNACTVSETITYNGSGHSLCIKTDSETLRPYASQTVNNIVSGVTYKLSVMLNIVSLSSTNTSDHHIEGAQACFKYNFYDKNGTNVGYENFGGIKKLTNGEWVEMSDYIVFPEEVASFAVWIRLQGAGEIYIDNASFKIVDDMTIDTDEIHYYSDLETGTATATLAPNPEAAYSKVKFSILDGSTEVGTAEYAKDGQNADVVYQEYTDGSATVKWPFKVSTMAQEKKAYTLKVTLFDNNGGVVSEKSQKIYKYARPSLMNKNGEIIIDGKKFQPGPVYHVDPNQYETVKQVGLNVVQASGTTVAAALKALNDAQAGGVKVMLVLYRNYIPAGHPDNAENTKTVINAVKNHPALLCYMSMDEPTAQLPLKDCEVYLPETYRLIRNLDDKHPIYTCQSEAFYPYMKLAAKCTDVLSIDPYPLYNNQDPSEQTKHTNNAVRATKNSGKAVWTILQTFAVTNAKTNNQKVFPSVDNYRNCYYRSLFAGANGIGIYPFRDAWSGGTNSPLSDYPLWAGMLEFHKNGGEASIFNDVFFNGKGKIINEFESTKVIAKTIEVAGKTYLVVVHNCGYKADETLNLVKSDGTTPIGNYTAKKLYGFEAGEAGNTVTGTNTLNITIEKDQVFVYELTAN